MEKRLYRSKRNKVVAGVAGGLGEYLEVDPVLIRLLFVIISLAPGFHAIGIIAYIVLWVAVPYGEDEKTTHGAPNVHEEPPTIQVKPKSHTGAIVWGTFLLTVGILLLGNNLFEQFDFCTTWPLILVAVGIALLLTSIDKKGKNGAEQYEG
ncbi:MAG: PspC domain-containing protein [Candidatus Kryptoniota bacterium]